MEPQPGRSSDLGQQAAKAAAAIGVYTSATAMSFASATAALVAFGVVDIAFATQPPHLISASGDRSGVKRNPYRPRRR